MMTTLERIEGRKARSALLFASSTACAEAIRAFLLKDHDLLFHAALLMEGTGLSPRRTAAPTLPKLVMDREPRPKNVVAQYPSLGIDPAALMSVSRLIWFFDDFEPIPPPQQTASYSCTLNVALGVRYGLPLDCYDVRGRPIRSPLHGAFADFANETLFHWEAERRAYTEEIKAEGLVLDPDVCEPALWSVRGGAIFAGRLQLSLGLTWRVRRLEIWMDSYPLGRDWSDEEEAAFRAEGSRCGDALRHELGNEVTVREW